MRKEDWLATLGMCIFALLFVFLVATIPSALHDHSCAVLEPGQVEGC